ncbi:MAG TPA: hypothetical protein VF677_11875 [Flavobacterium sp.]|jgi:hypothetical protein
MSIEPNYKLSLDEIINKIETVYSESNYLKRKEVWLDNITMSDSKCLPLYYDLDYNYLGFEIKLSGKTINLTFTLNKTISIKKNDE